jgi:type II secretory pathway predicted ATPase ExeA
MYEQFFGFSQKPFNVTPDPRFLFMTDSHQEALASLVYGVQERRGFISISGEIGTGKTTLLNYFHTILDPKVKTIFIFQTQVSFEELLEQFLRELKLPVVDRNKIAMTRKLKRYLLKAFERQENVAILIDEAQNLSTEVLEELRMLSNIETGEAKLFQMVLIGQPELEKKLNSQELRQLKQRIGIRRQIRPLSEEETRQYIEQRLQKMGSSIEEIFTPEALDLICRYTGGIFRTINILCDNAFLIGYSLKKKRIDDPIVREVLGDMGIMVPKDSFQSKNVYSPESVILAHYRGPSEQPQLEFGKQSPHRGGWTVSRILGVLALALVIYLGWVYLLNPAQPPGAIGDINLPPNQDRSITPSPRSLDSNKNLNPSSDQRKKESISLFPAKGSADLESTGRAESQAGFKPAPLSDSKAVTGKENPMREKLEGTAEISGGGIFNKIVEVPEGETLNSLIERYYPESNPTIVDYILESNPMVKNMHLILVKQKIIIPEIRDESLLVEPKDGTWKLHLGTFCTPNSAGIYKEEETLKGKEIQIVERRVSPRDTWYRVYAGTFDTKEEGLKTVQELKKKESCRL